MAEGGPGGGRDGSTRRRGAKCKRKITRISTRNQIAIPAAATIKQNAKQDTRCHETYRIQWRHPASGGTTERGRVLPKAGACFPVDRGLTLSFQVVPPHDCEG